MHEPLAILDCISAEEGRKLIDAAVEQHQASILALKSKISDLYSQRNYFAPTCRLPPEILCRIFSLVKGPLLRSRNRSRPFRWILLTHVCRHWRNVAIASPTLWANDPWPLENLPFLEQKLSRSKGVPLVIKVDIPHSPASLRGLELLLERSQRIKRLSVLFPPSHWHKIQLMLPKSAPQLEHISLECSSISNSSLDKVLYDVPKLRHLVLANFEVNWNSPSHLNHALTYLNLYNIEPRPTWKQFIDVLKGMPDLEVLELNETIPEEQGFADIGRINLASLRTLSLEFVKPREIKGFLSYITFPITTKVNIGCIDDQFSDLRTHLSEYLAELFQSISNVLPPGTSFQTLILSLRYPDPEVQLRLFIDALDDAQMLGSTAVIPDLDLHFWWSMPELFMVEDASTVLNDVFKSTIGSLLRNVSRLHLEESTHMFSRDALANVAEKLPKVRFIMAAEAVHSALIHVLQMDLDVGTAKSVDPAFKSVYFPVLSSLYLRVPRTEIIYSRSVCSPPVPLTRTPSDCSAQMIYDCLVHRRRAGAKIEELTLKLWDDLEEDEVDFLREIVPDFHWDNEDLPFCSDSE